MIIELLVSQVPPNYQGAGAISGTVEVDGSPASRPVVLFAPRYARRVARLRAATDGTWSLGGLSPDVVLSALAVDTTGEHKDYVVSQLRPVAP